MAASRTTWLVIAGLAVALGLALLSPLASKSPDGLEKVSETHGLAPPEEKTSHAPMPDYDSDKGPARKILAGITGTLIVFGATFGLAWAVRRRAPPA
jgi:cobalt/nickel transport protein